MPSSFSLGSRLGLVLFFLGVILIFLGAGGGNVRLMGAGIGAVCLAAVGFSLAAIRGRRGKDPLERRREQRLWKSGPLGRKWLEGRRRIP
jgi:drug/metabolite transporter (DMT)-like permease